MPAPQESPPSLTMLTPYLLSKVGKAARGLVADRLAARGLRLWHMAALASLADHGPQVQRSLASRLAVHPSDMAKVLDDLARRDWVDRTRDAADRRRVTVALTERGRAVLAELTAEAEAVEAELLAPLDPDDQVALRRLLLRVHDALR
ncbi:MarR family winged helix-turn-helix transcriptional regulator [Streptomyces sp. NPDC046261]|uniref:MarR family winged helix-turn-helix transcriptional regulator n=1 Tax=Streptomyces sp. NPDC046261 TaxID=3157200 RepID=UPI00340B2799